MKNNKERTAQLFASVDFVDGKTLKIYKRIKALEFKGIIKLVEQGLLLPAVIVADVMDN
ncbi:MAG: hypothetical protein P0Y49_04590 [Candidatus Pedobacter colombiensis]|uniref:Uncharacterized protein n=1 Tax=Candidatus Pedobacter colombiensis TaxID=3121371 RepID=A0AAJ6B7L4_9SPHI|nr:hypothetical protein [Pedobacter sp.]WEK20415.1 MAG: hypothetical protein P0Y49_04590 [Pedobacter sp.]